MDGKGAALLAAGGAALFMILNANKAHADLPTVKTKSGATLLDLSSVSSQAVEAALAQGVISAKTPLGLEKVEPASAEEQAIGTMLITTGGVIAKNVPDPRGQVFNSAKYIFVPKRVIPPLYRPGVKASQMDLDIKDMDGTTLGYLMWVAATCEAPTGTQLPGDTRPDRRPFSGAEWCLKRGFVTHPAKIAAFKQRQASKLTLSNLLNAVFKGIFSTVTGGVADIVAGPVKSVLESVTGGIKIETPK